MYDHPDPDHIRSSRPRQPPPWPLLLPTTEVPKPIAAAGAEKPAPKSVRRVAVLTTAAGVLAVASIVGGSFYFAPTGDSSNAADGPTRKTLDNDVDSATSPSQSTRSPGESGSSQGSETQAEAETEDVPSSEDESTVPEGGGPSSRGMPTEPENVELEVIDKKGLYDIFWDEPAADGGSPIVAYTITDCGGDELISVGPDERESAVRAEEVECLGIFATNKDSEAGAERVILIEDPA